MTFAAALPPPPMGRNKRILQWHFMGRLVVLSLLMGVSLLIEGRSHGSASFFVPARYLLGFIAALYFYTLVGALILNKIKRISMFAGIQIAGDIAMITLLVMASGGSQTIFTAIYFFPIITASFLFKRVGTLFIASLATILYGTALLLEYFGYVAFFNLWSSPLSDIMMVLHFFAIHGLLFFLVAGLSIFLAERMRSTERELSRSSRDYDRLQILYRQVFNDITTGIITLAADNRITSLNPAATEITGYQAAELIDRQINAIFPGFELDSTGGQRTVATLTRKNGRTIPVGFSWNLLNMPEPCDDCRVITMQDLSRIQEMEKKIKQAEKMATIGEMAAGIAHDFRNPLAAISGAAQVLDDDTASNSADSRLAEIIVRECSRMEETITDFLRFSKPAPPEMEWFSLHPMIDEIIAMFAHGKKYNEIPMTIVNLTPPDLDCWADPDQSRHILMNLVANSLNATNNSTEDPLITIQATEKKTGENSDQTVIEVEDNGTGIKEELKEKIFEPFFTTRENGTCLGLAIVKQIAENHKGRVELESATGKTIFRLYLPLPGEG